MQSESNQSVEGLLVRIHEGDTEAEGELFRRVYDELRRHAKREMRREYVGHTLQTTALVHEAFLKIQANSGLKKMSHYRYFFSAAAQAMRQILVDHARAKLSQKRGGDRKKLPLDEMLISTARAASPHALSDNPSSAVIAMLAVNDALDQLAKLSERQHQIVMLRFFGGLAVSEVAESLNISTSTVELDFRLARAWLRNELS